MKVSSFIRISRVFSIAPDRFSLEKKQKICGCTSASHMPIEVAVVTKDSQCAVEHVGHCSCEAFLVADRLATALGLPIYDDGNVL